MVNERFSNWDVADFIRDTADAKAYLTVALEESVDDPTAVPRALGAIARSGNMTDLARQVGMSREGLYNALSANGNPTWATIIKITDALGLHISIAPNTQRVKELQPV